MESSDVSDAVLGGDVVGEKQLLTLELPPEMTVFLHAIPGAAVAQVGASDAKAPALPAAPESAPVEPSLEDRGFLKPGGVLD